MKTKFFIDRKSFCGRTAITSAILAVIFRLIGSIGFWEDKTYLRFGLLLPVCACVIFVLCVFFLGKRAFWTSIAGVLAGTVFFIFRLLHEETLGDEFVIHDTTGTFSTELWTALFIAAYVVIAVLYILTVFSAIKTKWIIAVLFFIPFVAHLYYDYTILANRAIAVSAASMMNELSILTVLCGMFFVSAGLKKAYKVISEQTVTPPISDGSLSDEKLTETVAADDASDETLLQHNKPDDADDKTGAAPEKFNESGIPEEITVKEAAASKNQESITEEGKNPDELKEKVPEDFSEQDRASLEERLDGLPKSGPLTLEPIIPSEEDNDEAEDVPQGGDEPERRDAIAPKKGLGKFFSK